MIIGFGIILTAGALYAYGQYERLVTDREPADRVIAAGEEAPQRVRPSFPATRVVIAKINVDSPVKEAKIENGEWQVPKFVAGHLENTANPGDNGNVVLAGHIESISSGNVFARLDELRTGDEITLFAGDEAFQYRVTEIKVVRNDDLSVVEPTMDPTLTLITCTGTFDVLTRDYDHRLIVIAKPSEEQRNE